MIIFNEEEKIFDIYNAKKSQVVLINAKQLYKNYVFCYYANCWGLQFFHYSTLILIFLQ